MSSKTSTASKNKFYAAKYDSLRVFVPKGEKHRIQMLIKEKYGDLSMNRFVCRAIYSALGLEYEIIDQRGHRINNSVEE